MNIELIKSIISAIINKKNMLYIAGMLFIIASFELAILKDYSLVKEQIILLIWLCSIAIFILELISGVMGKISFYNQCKNSIKILTRQEKNQLLEMINDDLPYIQKSIDDPIMNGLKAKGIVFITSGLKYMRNGISYYIYPEYIRLLKNIKVG